MDREFISFEIASDLAHFRRPFAITTALTFPLPPRTALCGLVGALLGLPKNECLRDFVDEKAVFGLQLLAPYRSGHVSINLLQTKDSLLAWRTDENPHTAMRYEIIRNPRYRLFFSHPDLGPRLFETLRNGEAHYTPCLGLAWMIAWLESEPKLQRGNAINGADDAEHDFISPVRTDDISGEVSWDEEAIYQRVRMPATMLPDRRVIRHQEYLVETTTRPVRARLKTYWELEDGTCFSAL